MDSASPYKQWWIGPERKILSSLRIPWIPSCHIFLSSYPCKKSRSNMITKMAVLGNFLLWYLGFPIDIIYRQPQGFETAWERYGRSVDMGAITQNLSLSNNGKLMSDKEVRRIFKTTLLIIVCSIVRSFCSSLRFRNLRHITSENSKILSDENQRIECLLWSQWELTDRFLVFSPEPFQEALS